MCSQNLRPGNRPNELTAVRHLPTLSFMHNGRAPSLSPLAWDSPSSSVTKSMSSLPRSRNLRNQVLRSRNLRSILTPWGPRVPQRKLKRKKKFKRSKRPSSESLNTYLSTLCTRDYSNSRGRARVSTNSSACGPSRRTYPSELTPIDS